MSMIKWDGITKYHLYVFSAGEFKHRVYNSITPEGYIGDVPIEDFGDSYLSEKELTHNEVWDCYWKAVNEELEERLKEDIEKALKLFKLNKYGTFEEYWKAHGGLNGWQPPHIIEILLKAKTEEDVPKLLRKFWQI